MSSQKARAVIFFPKDSANNKKNQIMDFCFCYAQELLLPSIHNQNPVNKVKQFELNQPYVG